LALLGFLLLFRFPARQFVRSFYSFSEFAQADASLETADVQPYMSLAGVAENAATLLIDPAVSPGLRKRRGRMNAPISNEEDCNG
jgi:hypothetical protein